MMTRARKGEAGIMLIEALVYITILAVIFSLAASAYFRFQVASLHLRRNTEDISRALRAGERWRDEVRRSRAFEFIEVEKEKILRLDYGTNETLYAFQAGKVWRKSSTNSEWRAFLVEVKSSEMTVVQRKFTQALRWDFEFKSVQKTVRQRPLYSFASLPAAGKERE